MITKVISGGQTGADRGGLEGAKKANIETGGTSPSNYYTENGSDYSLKEFGLKATGSYHIRTKINIQNSDGTIIIGNRHSPGSRLTINTCIILKKPWMVIPFSDKSHDTYLPIVKNWIEENNIQTLNIAGNRESRNRGIQEFTTEFVYKLIETNII